MLILVAWSKENALIFYVHRFLNLKIMNSGINGLFYLSQISREDVSFN